MMTIHAISKLCVCTLLLTASTAIAQVNQCTAITSLPYTIHKQGDYCFVRSLSDKSSASAAITINANNVTIDLNGHAMVGLTAKGVTRPNGIYAIDRQNITIRNGSVRGFLRGIYLLDSSPSNTVSQRHLVENISVSNCTRHGILVWGSDNIVRDNQVVDTGADSFASVGIYLRGRSARAFNNDIIRTRATEALKAMGLYIENSTGAVINNNRIDTVNSPTGKTYGVRIFNSDNVMASGNRVSSVEFGIHFDTVFSSNGKYMDNMTANVTTPFTGGTAVGVND